jgi:hypothetical protein
VFITYALGFGFLPGFSLNGFFGFTLGFVSGVFTGVIVGVFISLSIITIQR